MPHIPPPLPLARALCALADVKALDYRIPFLCEVPTCKPASQSSFCVMLCKSASYSLERVPFLAVSMGSLLDVVD